MEWSKQETNFLIKYYPLKGKKWCSEQLKRSEGSIRQKTSYLGLYQNRKSDFFIDWQNRAANSKIGKKRPSQALVMIKNLKDGKMIMTNEGRKKISESARKRWKEQGHPKGMLGKNHSIETKNRLSKLHTKRCQKMTDFEKHEKNKKMIHTRVVNGTYAPHRVTCTWKAGWREFGGKRKYYRSQWEANYARYLEWLKNKNKIKEWFHEVEVFWFDGVKRGCVSYLPDFKIINNDDSIEYHEVKGWMDNRSKTKLKRMKKYYPEIKLIIIREKQYKEIKNKLSALIKGWE